jgi:hypothetical protein
MSHRQNPQPDILERLAKTAKALRSSHRIGFDFAFVRNDRD